MQRRGVLSVVVAAVVLVGGSSAQALINPDFTPIHLTEQAKNILKVTLKMGDKPGQVEIEIQQAFKPKEKAPSGKMTLDLTSDPKADDVEKISEELKAAKVSTALLFSGEFVEQGNAGAVREMPAAFIHMVGGQWLSLYATKDKTKWELKEIDGHMQATWAGTTDMLEKCVNYILTDKQPAVPCVAEAAWDKNGKIANVPGKISGAMPVYVGGKTTSTKLFVGSDAGDRLFAYDAKAEDLVDVTAKCKLTSKSANAVWGDFNKDGRADLVSWDGKALSLHLQQADGTFVAKPMDIGGGLKNVASLTVVDSGKDGQPGVVVGMAGGATVLAPAGEGKMAPTPLTTSVPTSQQESPSAGQCLAADFDGDGQADVLQMFRLHGVFYKGIAPGKFDKGIRSDACLGDGVSKTWLGDYDGDGTMDIFCAAGDGTRMWQNSGKGTFEEMRGVSGEVAYISKPGGIDGMTCDFNNDSRQDFLIVSGEASPLLFFNRGWRSTGHAHEIDLEERQLLEPAKEGLAGGCMGDFNGDAGQDMISILKNGDVYVFYRKITDGDNALAIQVGVSPAAASCGPINVTITEGKRMLGAWTVTAGSCEAFFGQRVGGKRTLQWQLPGGKVEQKDITVLDKPVRFEIGAPAK